MRRLLLIEDDDVCTLVVRELFEGEGFSVKTAPDGATGLAQVKKSPPDVLLLDLSLPGMPGLDVCREIRRDRALNRLPILMLTARGDTSDVVLGLEVGADDYVAKPFKPPELVARVKALLRRTGAPSANEALRAGGLVVDPATFTVTRDGQAVALSTLEFRLLYFLVGHPNQVFSRDQLLDHVWGLDRHVIPRSVDVYIRHLRKKVLPASGGSVALRTLRDAGYLLEIKKS
jgi:two-component system, OmpR family, phosphate regulon response regulator PhoB